MAALVFAGADPRRPETAMYIASSRSRIQVRNEFVRRLRSVSANTASLRADRKQISKEVAEFDRTALLGLAHHLIEKRIARFVAYELVLDHKPRNPLLD